MLKWLSYHILKLAGWKIDNRFPDIDKYVLVGAFHTSNWDFVYGILTRWALGQKFYWVGKHTLFIKPFGSLFRSMGGIPVDRRARHGFIQKMVDEFNRRDEMRLAILPEGTRSKVSYWKTGFYYIALQAQLPIVLGYFDYKNKIIGACDVVYPSGDIEKDFQLIKQFYADKVGKCPERQGAIRLKPATKTTEAQR